MAAECADDAALAAAHTVAAMIAAVDGDRAANQVHYMRALGHAEAAGDVLQIIRIRTNRGSRSIEEGNYLEGLAELDLAVDLAERSGYQSFAALALSNRGEAHLKLGRVDEAARDLEAAVARYVVLGSRLRAYPWFTSATCTGCAASVPRPAPRTTRRSAWPTRRPICRASRRASPASPSCWSTTTPTRPARSPTAHSRSSRRWPGPGRCGRPACWRHGGRS